MCALYLTGTALALGDAVASVRTQQRCNSAPLWTLSATATHTGQVKHVMTCCPWLFITWIKSSHIKVFVFKAYYSPNPDMSYVNFLWVLLISAAGELFSGGTWLLDGSDPSLAGFFQSWAGSGPDLARSQLVLGLCLGLSVGKRAWATAP